MGTNVIQTSNSATGAKSTRTSIRWLLVFYDSILFFLCWFIIFVLRPSISTDPSLLASYFYLFTGYVLIFGLRFLFHCYKHIWRYGQLRVFSRELLCCALGSGVLVLIALLLDRVFHIDSFPMITIVSFCALYSITSLAIRILYCYLFYFAKQDTMLSRATKFLLERFGMVDFSSAEPGAVLHLTLESDNRSNSPINELTQIAEQFLIHGDITSIRQINKGYINRTYRIETLSQRGNVHKYTLQRINTNVFPDVEALMANFKLTTDHLSNRLNLPGNHKKGSVQVVRSTRDGKPYLKDDSGYWRLMTYFDHVYSLDIPDRPETFYQAGMAFGKFLKEMSDVDASQIHVVIPNFHNTQSRYEDLEAAVRKDPKGRVKNVPDLLEFVRARSDRFDIISQALEEGRIPTRICHNDCNLNNILFDKETHLPAAIIDLDTVMPSSPLYDFGDSMRIGTNTAKDDETDLSKVSCDLNLYEQYALGYLTACGDVLTREELELMPYAALIITAEDGIRFLTDYINGDIYYNIYYPEQNLDRARNQLKLLEDMEAKLPEIRKILQRIYDHLGLKASSNKLF